uniref:Ig-like domain-containing protein n=1 Tax=Denticeps clupeoides TaxID=299321 RepID=A0AAY4B4N7_9TELE
MQKSLLGWTLFLALLERSVLCPIRISPQVLVVEYGSVAHANCSALEKHQGMGWESTHGSVGVTPGVSFLLWTVEQLKTWDITPQCFINLAAGDQCSQDLHVVVYKPPDNVSIVPVGPMDEGKTYSISCDIRNVAPAQNFTTKWYNGQTLLFEDELKVFSKDDKKTQNATSKIQVTPSRADDGKQYRCVVQLDLGREGPQPPPNVSSQAMAITVHYSPFLLRPEEEIVMISQGAEATLNCTAVGNPPPGYTWTSSTSEGSKSDQKGLLRSSEPGNYTCTASNKIGSVKKLFIIKHHDRTVFWAIIGGFLGLAVVIVATYGVIRMRAGPNSVI